MARKKSTKRKRKEAEEDIDSEARAGRIHTDTKKGVLAIVSFVVTILLLLSYLGKGGVAGSVLFRALDFLLGRGYFFAPVVLVLVGFSFLFSQRQKFVRETMLGGLFFLLFSLGIFNILFGAGNGGALGSLVSYPLLGLFDFWAGLVIAVGFWIISLLLVFNIPLLPRRRDEDADDEDEVKDADTAVAPVLDGALHPEESASLLAQAGALLSRTKKVMESSESVSSRAPMST